MFIFPPQLQSRYTIAPARGYPQARLRSADQALLKAVRPSVSRDLVPHLGTGLYNKPWYMAKGQRKIQCTNQSGYFDWRSSKD